MSYFAGLLKLSHNCTRVCQRRRTFDGCTARRLIALLQWTTPDQRAPAGVHLLVSALPLRSGSLSFSAAQFSQSKGVATDSAVRVADHRRGAGCGNTDRVLHSLEAGEGVGVPGRISLHCGPPAAVMTWSFAIPGAKMLNKYCWSPCAGNWSHSAPTDPAALWARPTPQGAGGPFRHHLSGSCASYAFHNC